MRYDPEKHHRRSIRLKGYDYSRPGAYFVTIVTQNRQCLFGDVMDDEMQVNECGVIVQEEWFRSAGIRREIRLYPNEFVVMPNHIHAIVWIVPDDRIVVGAHGRAPLQPPFHRPPRSLPSFIAGFKSATTRRINHHRQTPGTLIWQRNYYEHIIRDEQSLNRIRQYIATNPMRWHLDRENPSATGNDPWDTECFG